MVVRASYDVLQQAVRVVQGQTIICPPLDVECLWEKLTDVLEATANAVNPDSSVSSQLSALPATGFGNSYCSAFGNS